MSANDKGNQIITFDFRQEATSLNFNKYGTNIIRQGLYKGGKVKFIKYGSDYFYSIEPFTCAFLIPESTTSTNKLLVNVSTSTESTLTSIAPINSSSLIATDLNYYQPANGLSIYIVLDFSWIKRLNNYLDFSAINDLSSLSSTQIVLCKITGRGSSNKPLITYDKTTYGSFYEGYDQKYTSEGITLLGAGGNETSGTTRRLIPYISNSYLLSLSSYNNSDNNYYITFPPIDGEIELMDISDKSQKVKIIFDISGNLDLSYSAKMKVKIGNYTSDYLCISITNEGRLKIINGSATTKSYIFKSNIFNQGRILNTSTSLS